MHAVYHSILTKKETHYPKRDYEFLQSNVIEKPEELPFVSIELKLGHAMELEAIKKRLLDLNVRIMIFRRT